MALGTITTGTGLTTGLDIAGTVDKLMALIEKPKELLSDRTDKLKDEQTAVTGLTTLLYSLQYVTDNLGKSDLYARQSVNSSNTSVLTATASGTPALGAYQFNVLRTAQTQQWLGSGVASSTQALGGGTLSFRFGDNVQRSAALEQLNDGAGFTRGKIRIVDRSGAQADIDLSSAQTLDDILDAINGSEQINVRASAVGGHLHLEDQTGQTLSNLKVLEVGSGKTAASLGLDQVNAAAAAADGRDILALYANLSLDALNDGAGVRIDRTLPDIEYHLSDGTIGKIDLSPIITGSSEVDADLTLGDVMQRINAAAPGKLQAEIASDGLRLQITDLTSGGDAFTLASAYDSKALDDLGLTGAAVGGVITGSRLIGGLQTVLLSSLGGGSGLGELGTLEITDRSGASATVDLSAAETLDDVLAAINDAGLNVTARINGAKTGIELVDSTAMPGSHLIVASGDALQSAEKLQIAVDAAVAAVDSGDLHLQVVAENTRLDQLNGGKGVARGSFTIRDSHGKTSTINLQSDTSIQTVGDLIRAINRSPLSVQAELNETGDGIRLRDPDNAGGTLEVVEGSSTTAGDLRLLRGAVEQEIDGATTWVIDGSMTETITLDDGDTLTDLRDQINALGLPVSASIFSDGSSQPMRLTIGSQQSGRLGSLVVDTSALGFTLTEAVRGQDALISYGSGSAATLIASSSNRFTGVVNGLTLEAKSVSAQPVTVTVAQSDSDFVASVKTMVDYYNKFRDSLTSLTQYDSTTDTRGVLTGDATALRLDTDLSQMLTQRIFGAGSFHSLAELGVTVDQDGQLVLDEEKLRNAYAADSAAVEEFFSADEFGFSARIGATLEQVAGEDNSLLARRMDVLDRKITENEAKIESMTKLFDAQRERMLLDFYNMEIAVGKLQNNLTVLDSIQQTWLSGSKKSSSS